MKFKINFKTPNNKDTLNEPESELWYNELSNIDDKIRTIETALKSLIPGTPFFVETKISKVYSYDSRSSSLKSYEFIIADIAQDLIIKELHLRKSNLLQRKQEILNFYNIKA